MNWNDEVTLVSEKLVTDEIGNQIPQSTEIKILCEKKNVTRQEFYAASTRGFKPSLVLNIHGYEYGNQTKLVFENKQYVIIRTYSVDSERLELTCERDLGER
ncbi:phage head closure protein [Listeria monocytogenes]|uniref:phage head closure protein n=1 Tax=Listeria monocytogenes TaxID=1639 RepID=UPI000A32C020|nr:phage head closure protein [Listeria monocytogenes]EAE9801135.1 phage head-tail adapter protein [Listeria monocytogenes]EAG2171603.1 phage head-tail adapter protein [Listeria monocytogenes]EGO5453395.1 phage head closure protein [Listeria monocytogenes]EHF3553335.1 phage head closure protein [Listeria monocytogenes]EHX3184807.1 phage head closure protein [Listeria monocytogenes]